MFTFSSSYLLPAHIKLLQLHINVSMIYATKEPGVYTALGRIVKCSQVTVVSYQSSTLRIDGAGGHEGVREIQSSICLT